MSKEERIKVGINEFNEIADLNIDFEINVLDILLLINIILDD